MAKSNNPPHVIIELTKEEYDFLIENCESNISLSLSVLNGLKSRSQAQKIVELLEKFKNIRKKLLDAAAS